MKKHPLLEKAELYEKKAQENDTLAETADSERFRQEFLRLAADWRASAEKLRKRVAEGPVQAELFP